MSETAGPIVTIPFPLYGYESAAQGSDSFAAQLNRVSQLLEAHRQAALSENTFGGETTQTPAFSTHHYLRLAGNVATQIAKATWNPMYVSHYFFKKPQVAMLEWYPLSSEEGFVWGPTRALDCRDRDYRDSVYKVFLSFFVASSMSRAMGETTRPIVLHGTPRFGGGTDLQSGQWIGQSQGRFQPITPKARVSLAPPPRELPTAQEGTGLQRRKAILKSVAIGEPSAAHVVADEMAQKGDLEWKAILLVAAEQAHFQEGAARNAIKAELHRVAKEFYETQDPRWEPVVWAAVRRYSSMLARDEVGTLSEFLDWTGEIDARQVTLQGIQNIFATAPCEQGGDEVEELRNRVFKLAEDALRPETLAPGKPAALAMCSVSGQLAHQLR
jgi:hypothetical protein